MTRSGPSFCVSRKERASADSLRYLLPVRKIVRPFLTTYRWEIESYGHRPLHPLVSPILNDKTVYERNYIRHRVIPLLCELNPAFKEKVVSS
jgi:tRNA(Ile)-lysidine synthase TilS/MesJ